MVSKGSLSSGSMNSGSESSPIWEDLLHFQRAKEKKMVSEVKCIGDYQNNDAKKLLRSFGLDFSFIQNDESSTEDDSLVLRQSVAIVMESLKDNTINKDEADAIFRWIVESWAVCKVSKLASSLSSPKPKRWARILK